MRVRLFRDREITWQHLAATAAIPLSFPPVQIGGKWYVDGGAKGALPLWAAEEMGATRAIGVNCLTLLPFRLLRALVRPRTPQLETRRDGDRAGRCTGLAEGRRCLECGEYRAVDRAGRSGRESRAQFG